VDGSPHCTVLRYYSVLLPYSFSVCEQAEKLEVLDHAFSVTSMSASIGQWLCLRIRHWSKGEARTSLYYHLRTYYWFTLAMPSGVWQWYSVEYMVNKGQQRTVFLYTRLSPRRSCPRIISQLVFIVGLAPSICMNQGSSDQIIEPHHPKCSGETSNQNNFCLSSWSNRKVFAQVSLIINLFSSDAHSMTQYWCIKCFSCI